MYDRARHREALEYYLKAENADNGRAYYRAGQLYAAGWSSTLLPIGSKEHIAKVEELYTKAAEYGNPDATYALARFYYRMNLTDQPEYREKTRALLSAAAKQGNLDAQQMLANLDAICTPLK